MKYVVIVYSSEADKPDVFGPYNTHAEANHRMQQYFDEALQEMPDSDESDDSDASHFQISWGDTGMDMWISELQQ